MVEEDSEKPADNKPAFESTAGQSKAAKSQLPPPSPAHRAAMALNISTSLAPPPGMETGAADKTQARAAKKRVAAEQDGSIEIDMGDGRMASSRNPINEKGGYIGKAPLVPKAQEAQNDLPDQKNEPAVLKPQARPLSAGAARLIAKRRAMMEGQDQAGSFTLPGPGPDATDSS